MNLEYFRKLAYFLDTRTKWQIGGLLLLMLIGSFLEMIGIALIIPVSQVAVDPTAISKIPIIRDIISADQFASSQNNFLILVALFLLFYMFKNGYLLCLTWIQNRFFNFKQCAFSIRLLNIYLTRDYAQHLLQNSSEIIRNVHESTLHLFVTVYLARSVLILECLLVFAACFILFSIEPTATLLAIFIVGSGIGITYISIRGRVTNWGRKLNGLSAELIQIVTESMFIEIKVLGRDKIALRRYGAKNYESAGIRTRLAVANQLPRFVGEIEIIAAITAILFYVVLIAELPLVEALPIIGMFAAASIRILPSLNRIVSSATNILQSLVVIDRLYHDMRNADMPSRNTPLGPPITFKSDLTLKNVCFKFPSRAQFAVDAVNLEIKKGEAVAFVGHSGSGKTSLANLILGVMHPTTGNILSDGQDISENLRTWQDHIGYVPQDVFVSDQTLRNNIAFLIPDEEIDGARIQKALQTAQLEKVVSELEFGLDTIVGEAGAKLSGGQRQRIGIARALYNEPDILILDEATSSLDGKTEDAISEAIKSLHGKTTLIIIAHRLNTVRHCDKVFFMSEGNILDVGSFDELLSRNVAFREFAQETP